MDKVEQALYYTPDSEIDAEMASENAKPTVGSILRHNLFSIMHNDHFSLEQKKAAGLMAACKTSDMGRYAVYCPQCDEVIGVHYRSCNNRNCPNCQYPLQQKWVQLRKSEVVPDTPYFHIVLTLPHKLNPLIKENPRKLLGILFRTSAEAVIEMCKDPDRLGAKPGIVSVLHTWTQDLQLHYHVHMICSAGGLDSNGEFKSLNNLYKDYPDSQQGDEQDAEAKALYDSFMDDDPNSSNDAANGTADSTDRKMFFLPMNPLSCLFRGKYVAALSELHKNHELSLRDDLDYLNDPFEWSTFCMSLRQEKWVGFIARTFDGRGDAIDYLARYTFRTAISNSRIISYDGQYVSFTVRNNNAPGEKEVKVLKVHEFIERFLSHIIPKGFTRVRFYGFLANGHKTKNLKKIFKQLTNRNYEPSILKKVKVGDLLNMLFPDKNIGRCPCCGQKLKIIYGHPREYYDLPARASPVA